MRENDSSSLFLEVGFSRLANFGIYWLHECTLNILQISQKDRSFSYKNKFVSQKKYYYL